MTDWLTHLSHQLDTTEITSITKEFWMDICLDSLCFLQSAVTLTDCHCLSVCHCQPDSPSSSFSRSMSGKFSHAPKSEASGISSIGGFIGCPSCDCIWACKRDQSWIHDFDCKHSSSRRKFQSQESQTHNGSNETRRHDWSLNYQFNLAWWFRSNCMCEKSALRPHFGLVRKWHEKDLAMLILSINQCWITIILER